jgi:HTH-type transcriptional regulator / antitoxin HigA
MMSTTKISAAQYDAARIEMENILADATAAGGFDGLSKAKLESLKKAGDMVKAYEDKHYPMPIPQTIPQALEQAMFRKKLKQNGMARLLGMTAPKLSVIMNGKRRPTLDEVKAMHDKLGIDGNLLLEILK